MCVLAVPALPADMLLAPGPAAEEVSPGTLAASLLHALQDRGYVPEVSCHSKGSGGRTAAIDPLLVDVLPAELSLQADAAVK